MWKDFPTFREGWWSCTEPSYLTTDRIKIKEEKHIVTTVRSAGKKKKNWSVHFPLITNTASSIFIITCKLCVGAICFRCKTENEIRVKLQIFSSKGSWLWVLRECWWYIQSKNWGYGSVQFEVRSAASTSKCNHFISIWYVASNRPIELEAANHFLILHCVCKSGIWTKHLRDKRYQL